MCYPIPDSVPLDFVALIEPLVVVCHAVNSSGIQDFKDKSILIVGGGPIGFAMIILLRSKGAQKIYVSEPTLTRRKQTAEIADEVFDPLNVKVGDKCRTLTNGRGVDVAFDCAGSPPGMKDGMDALRHAGTYINVAGWESPVRTCRPNCRVTSIDKLGQFVMPFGHFMLKEITVKASMAYTDRDFHEVVDAFVQGEHQPHQSYASC